MGRSVLLFALVFRDTRNVFSLLLAGLEQIHPLNQLAVDTIDAPGELSMGDTVEAAHPNRGILSNDTRLYG